MAALTELPVGVYAVDDHRVHRYAALLREYASQADESALLGAYDLGRTALADGLGILEMVQVYSQVITEIVAQSSTDRECRERVNAIHTLFLDALSPFEMAHRGFRDAHTLLRRLNELLEDQSKRVASALHDEAAQLLIPLHLGLADLKTGMSGAMSEQVDRLRQLLITIEERFRTLSHELRPPLLDQFGLAAALELLCDSASKRWKVEVELHVSMPAPAPSGIETVMYRVVQEALTNVGKHSGAQRASVSIQRGTKAITCIVSDDGSGVPAPPPRAGGATPGLGLPSLRDRLAGLGGVLQLDRTDHGTTLTVYVPLED